MNASSNDLAGDLARAVRDRSALVGIAGLGYVGLPLAFAFVEKGFSVLGFDVDAAKVDALARGECYIKHLGGDRLGAALASGRLKSTADFTRLSEPDAILICVPTPLTPQREPDMSYVVKTARFEHAGLPPVEMRLLLQPEHSSQADRHFNATRAALRDYGTWFGAYPYGHITIVDPAWQSGSAPIPSRRVTCSQR